MKKQKMIRQGMLVLVGGGLLGLVLTLAQAQPPETKAASPPTNSAPAKAKAPKTEKPEPKKPLTGAELYSINCERCHQERYPTERTGAQWKTIMLHMQVRANIPVSQAKLILQYLQQNSGR